MIWKNSEIDKLFMIQSDEEFNELSLKIFRYQYKYVPIYQNYVDLTIKNHKNIQHYTEIPCLPIQFFKKYSIKNKYLSSKITFKSSGTTSLNFSKHLVINTNIYKKSSKLHFESFFSPLNEAIILALLPSYSKNMTSSLLYMINFFIQESKNKKSQFCLYDFKSLLSSIQDLKFIKKNIFLFGISYALLDFSEQFPITLNNIKIIETGGMKNQRKEITKIELMKRLSLNFNTSSIYSEYRMTELLSQSYATINGIY